MTEKTNPIGRRYSEGIRGELFTKQETPFNLAGEQIDDSITSEGEARVRALAESEARKAQLKFQIPYDPHKRRPSEHFV